MSITATHAQEANEPVVLDAITIYGARDATTLNDTAVSVGIVSKEEIEAAQIKSFRDAFRRFANVLDADWNDAGFVIRGVNSEGFVPGGAPLASVYVDGVLQSVDGARRGARGLWDVEQVEVYRGPQSTLSGRAALAGALYIKTKDPTFAPEAEIQGTIGNNSLYGTALMLNAPIIDNELAFRFAGEFQRSSTDLHYPTYERFKRFDDFSTDTYYNLRGKILWQPAALPGTRALLSYSFSHDAPNVSDIAGPGFGFSFGDKRGDFNDPVFAEVRSTDVHNVGLEITHQITEALKLTSLTGFSHSLTDRPSVNEGTPGELNVLAGDRENLTLTQELRLNYQGDRLKWVAGLYAGYEDQNAFFDRTTFSFRFDQSRSTSEMHNVAAFGEATYEILPTWKLTLGGRVDYTTQKNTEFFARTQPLGGATSVLTNYASEFDEVNFLPKIGIAKDIDENQTIGFTFSQGFRTGGGGFDRSTLSPYTYEPEFASTYELFYKGRLFDNRLTLNANLFYTKFTDQQVEMRKDTLDPLSNRITNAASARSFGFEIEPHFQVTDQLSGFLAIGYVNSEFEKFNDVNLGNLAGLPFPEAPEWSIGGGARYAFLNGFSVGADAKYTSSYLARFGTLPHDRMKARTIVNMQAGYKQQHWEVNAFAQNLLDEEYYTYNDNDVAATLGARRSFGLNLKAKL